MACGASASANGANMEDIIRDESKGSIKLDKMNLILDEILNKVQKDTSIKQVQTLLAKAQHKHRYIFPKSYLLSHYLTKVKANEVPYIECIHYGLIRKIGKSYSGVSVITVLTSAYPSYTDPKTNKVKTQTFSCPNNCTYCPTEEGQPKSYLSSEPAVKRAIRNKYDPVLQFNDRARSLTRNGHHVDKCEIIVLGGTWSCYPDQYKEEFVRDIYYSANVLYCADRQKFSLQQEIEINQNSKCRIIGLTLETRPDKINPREIQKLRSYGCTRVQIGVQHTDDDVLRRIKRGCLHRHTVRAIRLLKDAGFKVDIHLMPDLPGSNPQKDRAMFEYVSTSPDMQVDHHKWYPAAVLPHTEMAKEYEAGTYKPYGENGSTLFDLLAEAYVKMPHHVRINRIIRDIPTHEIIGGNMNVSMRKDLDEYLKEKNLQPNEIRSREIKMQVVDPKNVKLIKREFQSSGSTEYFISYEDVVNNKLLGFVRLRLPSHDTSDHYIPELRNSALIRELHVYGFLSPVGNGSKNGQHKGYGKKLLYAAEQIATLHNFTKIAVISGIGVRQYYKKNHYILEGTYMTKTLESPILALLPVVMVIILTLIFLFADSYVRTNRDPVTLDNYYFKF